MNQTTLALLVLLVVLIAAAISTRTVALAVSLVAFVGFNFFVLPPVGTFAIAKEDDVVALVSLLAVSLIGSHLSQQARRRAAEAIALAEQRNEADMARRHAETKAALIASLGHDLKTPLTALTIAAANVGTPGLSDAERQEQVEIVEEELRRLRRLFDNVVELASVETKAMTAKPEWVLPGDIVDAARRQAATALTGHTVSVSDEADDRLVQIDPRLTSAALAHVLENAGRYSPERSAIDIAVRVTAERLTVTVRDRGNGLPSADLERVFERFYRGSDTREPFGSGMGLAITRGLLAIEGGRVSAANDPRGGALFTIDVPVRSRPVAADMPVIG